MQFSLLLCRADLGLVPVIEIDAWFHSQFRRSGVCSPPEENLMQKIHPLPDCCWFILFIFICLGLESCSSPPSDPLSTGYRTKYNSGGGGSSDGGETATEIDTVTGIDNDDQNEISLTIDKVRGVVRGLNAGGQAIVILGNDAYLETYAISDDGSYEFFDIPDGTYFLKVDINGYTTSKAKEITIAANNTNISSATPSIDFETESINNNIFTYHWEDDVSRSGYQHTAYIHERPAIPAHDL